MAVVFHGLALLGWLMWATDSGRRVAGARQDLPVAGMRVGNCGGLGEKRR